MKRLVRIPGIALCAVAIAVTGFLLVRGRFADSPGSGAATAETAAALERAWEASAEGDYPSAESMAREVIAAEPKSAEARLILGEVATKQGRLEEALATYEELLEVSNADKDQEKVAFQCAGELLLNKGATRQAEAYFRAALKRDPHFPLANNRLAFLLGLEGRRWESLPYLVELVKQDKFSTFHLLLLANPRQNIVVEGFAAKALAFEPGYPIPRIVEAKQALDEGAPDRAAEIVQELVAKAPAQIEVKAVEGAVHLARNDADAFRRWSESLTLQHETHPECWVLRGNWARANGEAGAATRCYAEAFFRDPNSLEACVSLAQLLSRAGEKPELVEFFKQRAKLLEHLESIATMMQDSQQVTPQALEQAFASCDWLERYWEAWGWCRVAMENYPSLEWATTQEAEIEKHLVYDLPQTVIFKNINDWDYSKYPLPEWRGAVAESAEPAATRPASHVAFREVGADLGLDFAYEDGHEPSPDNLVGRKMYEVTGGGAGAIDYDLDLFPDLYFTQGAPEYNSPAGEAPNDRLMRNLSGKRFADVTAACGIDERSYSQGVAAGDVDGDGFADLYVGNIGRNRLFRNNGDGTFSEAPLPAVEAVWTTSVAIADLNADGHADLFDVTYLAKEAYERLCSFENNYQRACNPRIFPAEADRVLLGDGEGGFAHVSEALETGDTDGRGLGIVIADYFGTGRLGVFVANDMTANSFYVPQFEPGAKQPRFADEALLRGIAFDRRGRAQADMGVAFADFDGSGTFDLFTTTFFGDHNTLFLQEAESFADLSHSSNLAALSYQYLGFGTQAFDAELDGDPDLFVANGHIDDFRHQNLPYRMRAQMFLNGGAAKFDEVPPGEAGPYFSRELLGRGVARLDWDRDGREDLAVSHLGDPAVLLWNESRAVGKALRLSLSCVASARDATGTIVELGDGTTTRVFQVTAGSGFHATNENVLTLPVTGEGPLALRVRWPSGRETTFEGLAEGAHYRLVEGRDSALLLPR